MWWHPKPLETFNHEEKQLIMGCITQQLVKVVFGSHFYAWDNQIYQQQDGAPMGLESSCPVSQVLMDFWVEAMMHISEKMQALAVLNPVMYERLDIFLLAKYVDDVLAALETMRKGVRWDPQSGTLMWSPEAEVEDPGKNQ